MLEVEGKKRGLALFNLEIDSKPRGCVVAAVRVDDVAPILGSSFTEARAHWSREATVPVVPVARTSRH